MRYFAKRDPRIVPTGIEESMFDRLVPGYGHLATEDPAILKIIDDLGGGSYAFTEITKDDWDKTLELAKKNAWPTRQTSADLRNVLPQLRQSAANLEAAVAAGEVGRPRTIVSNSDLVPIVDTPPPAIAAHDPVEPSPATRKTNPLLKKTA